MPKPILFKLSFSSPHRVNCFPILLVLSLSSPSVALVAQLLSVLYPYTQLAHDIITTLSHDPLTAFSALPTIRASDVSAQPFNVVAGRKHAAALKSVPRSTTN